LSGLREKGVEEICQEWYMFSDGMRLPRPRPAGYVANEDSSGGEYVSELTEAYIVVESVLGSFGRGTRFPHRLRELVGWVYGKGEPIDRFRLFSPGKWLDPEVVLLGFTEESLVKRALKRFEARLRKAVEALPEPPRFGCDERRDRAGVPESQ